MMTGMIIIRFMHLEMLSDRPCVLNSSCELSFEQGSLLWFFLSQSDSRSLPSPSPPSPLSDCSPRTDFFLPSSTSSSFPVSFFLSFSIHDKISYVLSVSHWSSLLPLQVRRGHKSLLTRDPFPQRSVAFKIQLQVGVGFHHLFLMISSSPMCPPLGRTTFS